jgi:hypothetical protein
MKLMSITFLNRDVALRIIYRLCRKVRVLSDAVLTTGDFASDIFCVKWNILDWVVGCKMLFIEFWSCAKLYTKWNLNFLSAEETDFRCLHNYHSLQAYHYNISICMFHELHQSPYFWDVCFLVTPSGLIFGM